MLLSSSFKNYKRIVSTHMFLEDCIVESSPKSIENRARIKKFLVSEITTPQFEEQDNESIKKILAERKVDDLLLEFAHKAMQDQLTSIESEHIKEVINKFIYHTNSDEYIK